MKSALFTITPELQLPMVFIFGLFVVVVFFWQHWGFELRTYVLLQLEPALPLAFNFQLYFLTWEEKTDNLYRNVFLCIL
jgi:hypothetical protein